MMMLIYYLLIWDSCPLSRPEVKKNKLALEMKKSELELQFGKGFCCESVTSIKKSHVFFWVNNVIVLLTEYLFIYLFFTY